MKKETKKLIDNDMLSGSLDLLSGSTPKASELKRGTKESSSKISSSKKIEKVQTETETKTKSSTTKKVETKEVEVLKDEKLKKSQPKAKQETKTSDKDKAGAKTKAKDEELEDLEKINEEGLRTSATRGKRNQLVIIILSVLLAVAVAVVVVFIVMQRADTNCDLNVHGGVNAEYVVDGNEAEALRLRLDITSNSILLVDLNLKINDGGSFNVKYKITCFFRGEEMQDFKIYEPNREIFELEDGYFKSINPVSGTIALCDGIVINDEFGAEFNGYEFSMVVDTYIERA